MTSTEQSIIDAFRVQFSNISYIEVRKQIMTWLVLVKFEGENVQRGFIGHNRKDGTIHCENTLFLPYEPKLSVLVASEER